VKIEHSAGQQQHKPLPRATGEDLDGCGEGGFHWIGTTSSQADKGTASWYVVRAVPCSGVSRPSSLPAFAWIAAGEITADEFSMSADADTRGNGYVADKLRVMMRRRRKECGGMVWDDPTAGRT